MIMQLADPYWHDLEETIHRENAVPPESPALHDLPSTLCSQTVEAHERVIKRRKSRAYIVILQARVGVG
jgi:hypothetical protein